MMKAVIETATGKAFYLIEDNDPVQITESGMKRGRALLATDIHPDTHSLVSVSSSPVWWVGSGALKWEDDAWSVANTDLYATTLDARKEAMRAAVTAKRDEVLSGGFAYDFGGDIGIKRLQTRDTEDRTNWLTSQAAYSAAVAAGMGTVEGATFRTSDNTQITLSYADGLTVLLAMAAWGSAQYQVSWGKKDAITAAENHTALDAININSGWTE